MRTPFRMLLPATMFAGLLSACGSAASTGSATTAAKTGAVATATTAAPSGLPPWDENRKMNDQSGIDSPMAKIMGYDKPTDQTAQAAEFRQREQTRQEAIAECMQAEGFEYKPYVPSMEQMTSFEMPGADLTRKEYVAKYGFGISTQFEDQQRPPVQANTPDLDPNGPYVQGLTDAERDAYYKALSGDVIEEAQPAGTDDGSGDSATAVTIAAGKPGGCYGKAEEQAQNATDADRAFVDEMNTKMQKFYESVQADGRVVAANRTYASCMADRGYPEIDKQDVAYQKISDKMQPIYESMNAGVQDPSGTTGAPAATAAVSVPADGMPSYDKAKLAEVQTYELGVAKADLACGKDITKTLYEVNKEFEQKFVDENKADLERFAALQKAGVYGSGQG